MSYQVNINNRIIINISICCTSSFQIWYRYDSKQQKHNDLNRNVVQVLRSDLKFFGDLHWNWCVLDEGHVIKNHKSQLAVAVKKVHANHRLVLSGTPIQNNVLDLWSLFDFLMPGYMGEHSFFQVHHIHNH